MHSAPAQCQEPAIRVERQLGIDLLVATLIVAEQRLRARRNPFDRPADAARRPDEDGLLGIGLALHAKAAADIAGDHTDAAFRDMQDLMRQGLADAVHILRAGVERVAAGAGIIVGDAAARLHRDGGDAVVVERQPGDVMRPGKGGLDRIAIAHAHRERGVVGRTFMDQRRAGPHCILGAHHRGQHLVIDRHQLRRIARQCFRRGDHDRDALADIAHAILRQRRKLGAEARRPAHVLGHELGIEGAEPVGRPILAGQHCVNAG